MCTSAGQANAGVVRAFAGRGRGRIRSVLFDLAQGLGPPKYQNHSLREDRSDGFEISNGGFVRQRNDVARVLKHTDGMVSLASHCSVAVHAGMDERT
jgi:hypothetical protein